ncbi:MAG: VWA domain-containing protein [Myxococcales bacterium]|nr:VWA domain-containing protein [Myxococcales bacterium]MCB9713281.1 VWA domain-containing protein [Myxococcales bacterium]
MSKPPSEPLEALGRRIELLTAEPGSISAPFTRLLRPLLHRIGWKPKAEIGAVRELVAHLDEVRNGTGPKQHSGPRLEAAMKELRANIQQVERATVVGKRPLLSHAAWLRRVYELMVHAERAVQEQGSASDLVLAALPERTALLPPLAMGKARDVDEAPPPPAASGRGDETEPLADPARVLELQLDTIDHLLGAAREENALLDRRRRLLDAARQLLLETSAALDLDPVGVQERLESIAQQITRINRVQAAGLSGDVALLHQARRAMSRGERDTMFAALSELRRCAAASGDEEIARITTAAIDQMRGKGPSAELGMLSMQRSAEQVFGERVLEAVTKGYRRGRARAPDPDAGETDVERWLARQVQQHYAPGKERATLAHALTVDGCFEVGGVLSPVRVQERYIVRRVVPYPTAQLELVPASGPQDIPSAVVRDPRTIIMDLATGRLLARRFIQEEVATRPRTVMQGEVRIYVLDGSSSMLGPRARMRDSLMVAELATLLRRLENPTDNTRVVLYYRYFNAYLGPLTRVDSPGGVIEAIADVTGTPRTGDTDIQTALVSSLQLIAQQQREDSDLARAQIVLVTDGVAPLSEEAVMAARRELGDLPVGISVIALGVENEALRQLVAHQRANNERAFYHFLPDRYLKQISEGRLDADMELHLPPVPRRFGEQPLQEQLGPLLDELVDLQRSREAEARRELDRVDRERRLERADLESAAGEGERARLEALYRDDRALQQRFDRWFPPSIEADAGPRSTALRRTSPEEGTLERDDLDSMLVVLTTISEVVETVGSGKRGRQADAVDLLDRLLPDARLTPGRYHELLRSYPDLLAPALQAVHGAVRAGLAWRIENPGRGRSS